MFKHLFDLPISAVKLDVGTLHGLPTDRRCRAKATAIIRLAQALGLQVIVEGVDCAGVAAFVRPHCPSLQGRHVAAPMSADQLTDWLAQHRPTAAEVAADVAADVAVAAVIAVAVAAPDADDAGPP